MLRITFLAALGLAAAATQAAPVSFLVNGTARIVEAESDLGSATGQAIRTALDGQSGQWSITVDTGIADDDPSADRLDLRGGVTSSAVSIAGLDFGAAPTPCLNLDFDCRATAVNNEFADSDRQSLSSQVLRSAGFALGDLTFFLGTTGVGLFDTPAIVDPLAGAFSGRMSVFFVSQSSLQVVRFAIELEPGATVPVPGSLPLAGLGLAALAMARRRRR